MNSDGIVTPKPGLPHAGKPFEITDLVVSMYGGVDVTVESLESLPSGAPEITLALWPHEAFVPVHVGRISIGERTHAFRPGDFVTGAVIEANDGIAPDPLLRVYEVADVSDLNTFAKIVREGRTQWVPQQLLQKVG